MKLRWKKIIIVLLCHIHQIFPCSRINKNPFSILPFQCTSLTYLKTMFIKVFQIRLLSCFPLKCTHIAHLRYIVNRTIINDKLLIRTLLVCHHFLASEVIVIKVLYLKDNQRTSTLLLLDLLFIASILISNLRRKEADEKLRYFNSTQNLNIPII